MIYICDDTIDGDVDDDDDYDEDDENVHANLIISCCW